MITLLATQGIWWALGLAITFWIGLPEQRKTNLVLVIHQPAERDVTPIEFNQIGCGQC